MTVKRSDLPEIYAGAFVERFGSDCAHRLIEIADMIGLQVEEVDIDGFDGALLRVKGRPLGTVLINCNNRSQGRKIFTIAHEIGHFILPRHDETSGICRRADIESWDQRLHPNEVQANKFAAAILIPQLAIEDILRQEPSAQAVGAIAERQGTSLTASARRLVELSPFRVAMIWSESGRMKYSKRSRDFGRAIRKDPKLDRRTIAAGFFERGVGPSDFEIVPADAWLYEENLKYGATVLEYSVFMSFYDAVLTLIHIPGIVEERSDYFYDE